MTVSKVGANIDLTTNSDLARLAEEVHASRQPCALQEDGVTIAVVRPIAAKPAPKRSSASAEAAVARLRGTHGTVTPHRRPEDFPGLRGAFEEGVTTGVFGEIS